MTESMPVRVAVIGGGAAGLMAAIAAAQSGARVTVLERCDRVGRKLLSTGNGRCNLTNLRAQVSCYRAVGDPAAAHTLVAHVLSAASPRAVLAAFEALGLLWREEADGRVFPYSGQASAVLDVLRLGCARLRVDVRCGQAVCAVHRGQAGFALTLAGGRTLCADRVIVAAGGKASPQLGSDGSGYALLASFGHKRTPCYPALVQLRCARPGPSGQQPLGPLKGLRVQAEAALLADQALVRAERGEVLFTAYGLSGIAAMALAREAALALAARREAQVCLALLPQQDLATRKAMVRNRRTLFADEQAGLFATGVLPRRIGEALCRAAGIPLDLPCGRLTDAQADALGGLLGDWRFSIDGVQPFDSAQVTAGGIETGDFEPSTLESILMPGLFAAGEVLDVDGDCGGFNLQFAWATGLLAGRAAAIS